MSIFERLRSLEERLDKAEAAVQGESTRHNPDSKSKALGQAKCAVFDFDDCIVLSGK